MDPFRATYLKETIAVYRQYENWANQAFAQLLSDAAFFQVLGPRSHSIAVTVKHVAGNLRSRWRNFLTEDGEKPDRNRDQEFIIAPTDTRISLMTAWQEAWKILYAELGAIQPADLDKTVTIRGEVHTVPLAIQRSLAHTAYHVGQILYLCRLLKEGDWKWITIAPGMSDAFNEKLGVAKK